MSHKCVEEFGYKGYLLPANARAPRSARVMALPSHVFGLVVTWIVYMDIGLYDYLRFTFFWPEEA